MPSIKLQRNLLLFATLAIAAAPAFASPIFVSNASFETLPVGGLAYTDCATNCSYSIDAIPGWVTAGKAGQWQPGSPANAQYFTALSDGPTSAFESTPGAIISQTVGPSVVVGQIYVLSVDLGFRLDSNIFPAWVDLLINGNRYARYRGCAGTWYLRDIPSRRIPGYLPTRGKASRSNCKPAIPKLISTTCAWMSSRLPRSRRRFCCWVPHCWRLPTAAVSGAASKTHPEAAIL